jgi:tetratricopeptide (TPR) repeat protein
MATTLGPALAKEAPLMAWKDFEIRKVKILPAGEALAVVRHGTAEGLTLKMRWWLVRRPAGWKVYDFEDLDMGTRVTTMMGVAAAAGPERAREIGRATAALRDVFVAVNAEDADTAERKLKEANAVRLPRRIDAVRWLATGMVRLLRGQFREALRALDQAAACNPDVPALDLLRGTAHNGLGEWATALRHLDTYRDLLGDDATVCRQRGDALRGLGRFRESAAQYRKALDYNPKEADAFLGLLHSLTEKDRRDDVPARFARLDNPRETFVACAESLHEEHDGTGLEQVALAMRKIDPNFAPAAYYLALARAWAGRSADAVPLFRFALAREKDAKKRSAYVTGFLQAMLQGGKPVEGYSAAPAPREAFRRLAADLKQAARTPDLQRLVAAHARKDPGDPLLPFYRAEGYVLQGKYPLAEKSFAAGMAKPPDPATLATFRASRVLARFHAGRALSAYREIGPRDDTFAQLAALLFDARRHADLQKLLDAHARAQPGSADAARWRYRLKIRQGRTDEATALFRSALARHKTQDQRRRALAEFLDDMRGAGKLLEGYRAAPDARSAFALLANELVEDDDYAGLRRLMAAHRRARPGDPWLHFYAAELHEQDGAWGPCAGELVRWWKQVGADERGPHRFKYVYTLYKAGKPLRAYREAPPRADTFEQLARLLTGDGNAAALEALIAAHRPHAAGDPALFYFEARARLLRKQPARALPLFRKAYRKQPLENLRRQYLTDFVLALHKAGRALEGYRSAPDKALAFETLARHLTADKKAAPLERLLAEHARGHQSDPYYHFYCGELALLRGDPAAAQTHFAAARKRAPRPDDWPFRNGLARARVKAGKVAATYRELGPNRRTFAELARLCQTERSARGLEELLAAHRRADPADPDLPAWDLELRWLRKDYEGALKLLGRHAALFSQPQHRGTRDGYRVRALVRLKRADEAARAADALAREPSADPLLRVLAHAAHGDVKQAMAAMGRPRPDVYLRQRCYRDEDLGPILRGRAFREFRRQFPEPGSKRP